jgi:actin-related protein
MCNGVYVESGDGQTSVVSILQGYVMAMENYHFAGKDVNDHLRNLLMNIGHYLNNPA